MRQPTAATFTATVLLALTLAACAPHHTSIAAPTVTAPHVNAPHTNRASTAATRHSTPAPPAATGSATTHPTATDPAHQTPASASAPFTATAVQAYLQVARSAYPTAADPTLIATAHQICTQHAHGSSTDDLTGDLTSHLGNQALAHRLITTALAAYCP